MDTATLVCCLLGVLLLTWLVYTRYLSRYHILLNRIPGPRNLPLLGNALDLKGGFDHLLKMFQVTWFQQYGGVYRIFIGTKCFVNISSPEINELILSSQKLLDKGEEYELFTPWLNYGLLVSTGDKWRSRRKLLTPAFHFQILDNFMGSFNEQSKILCKILDKESQRKNGKEIDLYPLVTRCALDIVCEAAMGSPINAQTAMDSPYFNAVYEMGQVLITRFQWPWLWNDTIFSLTSLGRRHDKLLKVLHGFTNNIINNRRLLYKNSKKDDEQENKAEIGIKKKLALLDLLLEASDDGRVLSHNDIREEIDTFLFEGHDTTSAALGWFLYCMASNPEHQEKVADELRDIFGDSDRDCNKEDLANLKYTEMCLKETLRLYPSVPALERHTRKEVKLGDYTIPAGCTLNILVVATHQNPQIYPDPTIFDPERFSPENCTGRHPYAYIPFSAGPRNCIGQKFAMMEIKVILSFLMRRFKFQLSPTAKKPVPSTQIILKSVTGINLLVSRRFPFES